VATWTARTTGVSPFGGADTEVIVEGVALAEYDTE